MTQDEFLTFNNSVGIADVYGVVCLGQRINATKEINFVVIGANFQGCISGFQLLFFLNDGHLTTL